MKRYFTITTNKMVAQEIEIHLKWEEKMKVKRSLALGKVAHHEGYSIVQICQADENKLIEPEDIFWLGKLSGTKAISN